VKTVRIGDTATLEKVIAETDITAFAEVSGDYNPVHFDDGAAAALGLPSRIAHGMLAAALISRVLGNQLPGSGTIYLSQSLNFRAPVFIGDELSVEVELASARPDKPVMTFRTTCRNQSHQIVVDGEAVVLNRAVRILPAEPA